MKTAGFIYAIVGYKVENEISMQSAITGNAFSVAPGILLTCRHVVNGHKYYSALDNDGFHHVSNIIYPNSDELDLALLYLEKKQKNYSRHLPLLPHSFISIGENVYTYGMVPIDKEKFEGLFFKGSIVSTHCPSWEGYYRKMRLQFPVLQGLSGSPLLTTWNGVKVCGILIGNLESRIVVYNIREYEDDNEKFRHYVEKVIEFGIAYHPAVIEVFLTESNVSSCIISDQRVAMDGLNDDN